MIVSNHMVASFQKGFLNYFFPSFHIQDCLYISVFGPYHQHRQGFMCSSVAQHLLNFCRMWESDFIQILFNPHKNQEKQVLLLPFLTMVLFRIMLLVIFKVTATVPCPNYTAVYFTEWQASRVVTNAPFIFWVNVLIWIRVYQSYDYVQLSSK